MTNGITVIAIENSSVRDVVTVLKAMGIACYEMAKFFETEKFTTLEQVEMWWEEK
jgi:hypothetical protein